MLGVGGRRFRQIVLDQQVVVRDMAQGPALDHPECLSSIDGFAVHQIEVQLRVLINDFGMRLNMASDEILWHAKRLELCFLLPEMLQEHHSQLAQERGKSFRVRRGRGIGDQAIESIEELPVLAFDGGYTNEQRRFKVAHA